MQFGREQFLKNALLLFCLFSLFACASSGRPYGEPAEVVTPAAASTDWQTNYRLGTGDRIRVEVFREPDLTVEAKLDASGLVNFPLLGTLRVSGLTTPELERYLRGKLAGDFLKNPQVRTSIIQYRPVYVSGAVRNPGAHDYIDGLTVEQLLILAGGTTPQASLRRIFILAEGAPTTERARAQLDSKVRPGETVLVEEGVF